MSGCFRFHFKQSRNRRAAAIASGRQDEFKSLADALISSVTSAEYMNAYSAMEAFIKSSGRRDLSNWLYW